MTANHISPCAFTEQAGAMLRSRTGIEVNIQVKRVFTKMKHVWLDNKELLLRMEKIEHALLKKDEEVEAVFKTLKRLLQQPEHHAESRLAFLTLTRNNPNISNTKT